MKINFLTEMTFATGLTSEQANAALTQANTCHPFNMIYQFHIYRPSSSMTWELRGRPWALLEAIRKNPDSVTTTIEV